MLPQSARPSVETSCTSVTQGGGRQALSISMRARSPHAPSAGLGVQVPAHKLALAGAAQDSHQRSPELTGFSNPLLP